MCDTHEHGYPSWAALVHALEANEDALVRAVTDGRRARAEALLAARPELERAPWARLVLGRGWDGDANEPGGPRGWAPLLYVCHSCFPSVELARELLDRGADPNAFFVNEHGRMSALDGAAGRAHHPALTRLLLERGANPNDGESLYHACEADAPECVRLLLEAGAETRNTNALPHALDFEHTLGHVRLLLRNRADVAQALAELGADTGVPPEDLALELDAVGEAVGVDFVAGSPLGTLLHHAAWVGRSGRLARGAARRGSPESGIPVGASRGVTRRRLGGILRP